MKKKVLIVMLTLIFCQFFPSPEVSQEVKQYEKDSQKVIALKIRNQALGKWIKFIFPVVELIKDELSSDSGLTPQEQEELIQEVDDCQKELKDLQLFYQCGQIEETFSQARFYSKKEIDNAFLFLLKISRQGLGIVSRLQEIIEKARLKRLRKYKEFKICRDKARIRI